MTGTVRLRALFLHDTQTADLCREQVSLSRTLSEVSGQASGPGVTPYPTRVEHSTRSTRPEPALHFRFMLPFCPLSPDEEPVYRREGNRPSCRLIVKAPVPIDGWIIRPVRLADQSPGRETADGIAQRSMAGSGAFAKAGASAGFQIPGYPPFPARAGFILGFAGDRAAEILEGTAFRDFSVRVWYYADLSIEATRSDSGCLSVAWQADNPEWIKADR